jgi:hypothetical protein
MACLNRCHQVVKDRLQSKKFSTGDILSSLNDSRSHVPKVLEQSKGQTRKCQWGRADFFKKRRGQLIGTLSNQLQEQPYQPPRDEQHPSRIRASCRCGFAVCRIWIARARGVFGRFTYRALEANSLAVKFLNKHPAPGRLFFHNSLNVFVRCEVAPNDFELPILFQVSLAVTSKIFLFVTLPPFFFGGCSGAGSSDSTCGHILIPNGQLIAVIACVKEYCDPCFQHLSSKKFNFRRTSLLVPTIPTTLHRHS